MSSWWHSSFKVKSPWELDTVLYIHETMNKCVRNHKCFWTVMLCTSAVLLHIKNSKVATAILILHCPPLTFKSIVLLSPAAAFPVSLLGGFILFLVQLTGAHVFRALVVVCNKSQINAACCHKRDWSTTRNAEQMDTKVWLLEKYFPLVLQAPFLLSVTGRKKMHLEKTA